MPNVVIIGGGPAGLSAAIYLARAGIGAKVLYKDSGALGKTRRIENYFGFAEEQSGESLLSAGRAQAERLGARLIRAEATGIEYAPRGFSVKTTAGTQAADAVILATGSTQAVPRTPGLAEFEGRGVSSCAVCDAFFYRGLPAAVLGQGEYALEEARVLLAGCSSVTLLTNGEAPPEALPAGLLTDTRRVKAVCGGQTVERVEFETGAPLLVCGVFTAFGTAGSGDFARKLGAQTDGGHIRTEADGKTAVPGLFAAGDCTGGLKQVAKAVADGAQAALACAAYLRGGK